MEQTDETAVAGRTTPSKSGFRNLDHSAADVILAVAFNFQGTRIALCSADHRIQVFSIDSDGVWTSIDQWRGHDAEILDVKWVGSSLGNVFGTIGDDNKFKLWREDFSQAAHSGRRFRCIFSQSPSNHVAYVSLDIHTIKHDVWLCLITHDGLLSLWEPLESESLGSWKELDAVYPFGQYSRGSEPTFRLSFHKSERPNHSAISAGLDPRTLSIALSATNVIKINRAFKLDDGGYQLNEVLEMNTHAVVINDIAWAPGCIHMRDLIATACDDGCTRVFEVTTPHNRGLMASGSMESPPLSLNKQESSGSASHTKSGIGAGLENASRVKDFKRGSGTQWIRHEWKQVAKLAHRENLPAWRVQWLYDGSALASTGDSGTLHIWKQNYDGQFVEFAETALV